MKIFIDANLLIYLNTLKTLQVREQYEEFYLSLISSNKAYTDPLVLDELLYISKRRHNVPYEVTLDFTQSSVLPYIQILPLRAEEYHVATTSLKTYGIKPSDALHLATMSLNGIGKIASEDKELDKVKEIERIWLAQR